MKQSGHTVLITGGASGIGLALAEHFIQHDNKVIVVGRNEHKLNELKLKYPSITIYGCDLGEIEQVNSLVEQIYVNHPELNVIINNAGMQHNYSFLETSDRTAQIVEEIAVNVTSPILLISKLLPVLKRSEQAAIINVSSGLGIVPKKTAPVYCATKAGLHIFTKALRYQLEHTNINVFEIIPPIVDTEMTRGRGKNKITPEELVAQFKVGFRKDQLEIQIGKVKWLTFINRWYPALAEKILKNS